MNLASRNYQEKRNFIRMKVDTPVEVISQKQVLSGVCHNLSGGGMLISLDEPLPLGSQLEVTVSSNHGHNPMLHALTQVQRAEPQLAQSKKPCHLGLAIIRMLD